MKKQDSIKRFRKAHPEFSKWPDEYIADMLNVIRTEKKAADSFLTKRINHYGIYTCGMCGKKTRDTGKGECGTGFCYSCYSEMEEENSIL